MKNVVMLLLLFGNNLITMYQRKKECPFAIKDVLLVERAC